MFVRLSFDGNQDVSLEELKKIENTLADEVPSDPLVYKGEDFSKLELFYSWQDTFDLQESLKEDAKKKLVRKSDFVRLKTDKEFLADLDLFITKHPSVKVKIRGMVKTIETNYIDLVDQMQNVQKKFDQAIATFDKQIEFNEKCEVHIANLGLLHINQVGFAVDYCTEALQGLLNQGWRIVACCVQPARRPDYILGRFNPDQTDLECIKF
jgi:hypothetical protein